MTITGILVAFVLGALVGLAVRFALFRLAPVAVALAMLLGGVIAASGAVLLGIGTTSGMTGWTWSCRSRSPRWRCGS